MIPELTTREQVPLKRRTPASVAAVPTPKWVMVAPVTPQAGKVMAAALLAALPDTVHPEPERATATRA